MHPELRGSVKKPTTALQRLLSSRVVAETSLSKDCKVNLKACSVCVCVLQSRMSLALFMGWHREAWTVNRVGTIERGNSQ